MLKVRNISFSYSDKDVLDDVSFDVEQGQVFAILGPNGAGKTTLFKLLTGVLSAGSGTIEINNNQDPVAFNSNQRKDIASMNTLEGIYLKMTGYEYLSFIGALYEMPSDEIKSCIEQFRIQYGLGDELHREIKKYSSGTKKKIEFFSSIMTKPKILFLDEPFESVDPVAIYELKEHLKIYIKNGGTIVIISHILDTIQNIASDYLIINKGKIIYTGHIGDIDLEKKFMDVLQIEESEDK